MASNLSWRSLLMSRSYTALTSFSIAHGSLVVILIPESFNLFITSMILLFLMSLQFSLNVIPHTNISAFLTGMSFDSSSYSSEENITRSISNFKRLIEWLKNQKPDDAITDLISRSLVEKIQEIPIMRTIIGEPETEK